MKVFCKDCKVFCHFDYTGIAPTWICPKCKNRIIIKTFWDKTKIICIDKYSIEYQIYPNKKDRIFDIGKKPKIILDEKIPCKFELWLEI